MAQDELSFVFPAYNGKRLLKMLFGVAMYLVSSLMRLYGKSEVSSSFFQFGLP